jgi:hypothetical protein
MARVAMIGGPRQADRGAGDRDHALRRRQGRDGGHQGVSPLSIDRPSNEATFLDLDDRLGPGEPKGQAPVLAHQLGVPGGQRIGDDRLGTPRGRLRGLMGALVALLAPVGQRGRIQTLPARNRADAPRRRPVDLAQDPRLLRRQLGVGPLTRSPRA